MLENLPAMIADRLGYCGGNELASDAYFPYIDHWSHGAMLCTDGSLLGVTQLDGAPVSLSLNRQRNANKVRLVALLNAMAAPNVEVHLHCVRHDATLPPSSHNAAVAPYARLLMAEYHATIEPDMAVIDWFVSIRVMPRKLPFAALSEKVRDTLVAAKLAQRKARTDQEMEVQLEDAMHLALNLLEPCGPRRLGQRFEPSLTEGGEPVVFSEIAEFLHLLLTTQFSPQPMADVHGFLGAGIASIDVTTVPQRKLLKIEHAAGGDPSSRSYVAMMGLLVYPQVLDQSRYDDILALPGRFVWTVALGFKNRADSQSDLKLLKRRLDASGNSATDDNDDLEKAISAVAGGKADSGTSRWSLALHAATPVEVDRLASAAANVIAASGAKVGLEGALRLTSFYAQLPGAPRSTWGRPATCTTKQVSTLASLAGYARGPAKARWGSHLFRMVSPANTAFDFDLFVKDIGHNGIGGPSGGGKSVFLGTCIAAIDAAVREVQFGKKPGCQIVLDVDESNHNTIIMLGGRYSTVVSGRSGLAPLRGFPDTVNTRAFLRDLVAGLIRTDGSEGGAAQPTMAEREAIRNGVDYVMGDVPPEHRSLQIVRDFLPPDEGGAGERLEPWCRGGELGWVFDSEVHDIDFDTRLVGVDLTAVMDDKRVMPPLALTLLWMASDVMDGRRVVIWCEEAPAYMPTPAFARPFKQIALRARKRNASFNAIFQQPGDMLANDAGATLIRQALQFVLFRNDKAVEDDYVKGMALTPAEFGAISEGMFRLDYHTVLIKRQDGQSGVNKFDLSALPQHLNILSGTPSRVRLLKECVAHQEGDLLAAYAEFQSRILETAA